MTSKPEFFHHFHKISPLFAPTLNLGDEQLSRRFEDPSRLSEKLDVVCAHQRETKHADIGRLGLDGQIGDI
jgi:hypothetical protein